MSEGRKFGLSQGNPFETPKGLVIKLAPEGWLKLLTLWMQARGFERFRHSTDSSGWRIPGMQNRVTLHWDGLWVWRKTQPGFGKEAWEIDQYKFADLEQSEVRNAIVTAFFPEEEGMSIEELQ